MKLTMKDVAALHGRGDLTECIHILGCADAITDHRNAGGQTAGRVVQDPLRLGSILMIDVDVPRADQYGPLEGKGSVGLWGGYMARAQLSLWIDACSNIPSLNGEWRYERHPGINKVYVYLHFPE